MTAPGQVLLDQFQQHWQHQALRTLDGNELTYGDLWETARLLADRWQSAGYSPGDIIAFKLENSYALPCLYLACAIGGYLACPIVPTLANATVAENLAAIKPALLIEATFEPDIVRATQRTASSLQFHDDSKAFLIMFSSGSTGKNKAICHSLANVCGSAAGFAALSGFDSETRLYHVLPMTYMAGFLNTLWAVLISGGCVVEGPRFTIDTVTRFWQHALTSDANVLSIIPPIAAAVCRLTRNPETIAAVSKQFDQVQCTSQALQRQLRKKFLQKFSLPLRDCYGMTELGGALTLQSEADATAMNNVSTPMKDIEIEIRAGTALWIRSPHAMLGYLVDGELTQLADASGFIDTGDLATFQSGKLEITGRVKDIIIRGGINTSPARIESALSQCPGIDDIAVVSLPHDFWGEEIIACVVGVADEADILSYSREVLDNHEVPDRVVFMASFPRSFIGKVLKKDLREKLAGYA